MTLAQTLIRPQTVGPASIPLKQNIPNNLTRVKMGMPFKPDTMTQGNSFSLNRAAYNKGVNRNVDDIGKGNSPINSRFTQPVHKKKWYGASASRTSSEHTNLRTIEATGKSSTNRLLPPGSTSQAMSFSGPDKTTVNNALVRCRANGCVAPKKKGASHITINSNSNMNLY
jgi:hypothetical protein